MVDHNTMTRSRELHDSLGHPVIDGDGHWLETIPVFLEYLREIGGARSVDAYLSYRHERWDVWYESSPAERLASRRLRASWWTFPADTLDRATEMMPELLYERLGEFGLDFAVVYPTLGLGVNTIDDPDLRAAFVRALNVMSAEMFAPFADRMTPVATIPTFTPNEAIEELEEIKDFLKDPARFQAVGARIPKGVLLYGPPGTGKTLLARAVAGEAGVPFYSISGSDFVEMFVGVGASRVRDLFTQAKENSPAIIFVDEIDAVGRHRGAGIGGGNDEREQTLNQLLVEMDGFDVKTNVILIAATNRPDVLDPALLRPGRFDRQIGVDSPDLIGRKQILEVHGRGKPLAAGVDLEVLARKTPGFTGADLANVLNEAALLTARSHAQLIDNRALDEAVDRVMAGPQRRSRIMADKEKLITAYHEGGHALAAAAMRHTDPVTKVTILPRGRALGYTMVLPLQDKYSITRNELLDQLAYAMGGRVAEEIVFHDPTSGASNDIEKATSTARKMVTEYGMSAVIGSVKLTGGGNEPFMGRDMGGSRDYSENMAEMVDAEVRLLIEQAHTEAWEVINDNRDVLDNLATELLEKETLDHEQLAEIFKDVKKLPERPQWLSSKERPLSNLPAVKVPSKAPIDSGVVDGGVQSDTPSKPKRTPRPRKSPGIATA